MMWRPSRLAGCQSIINELNDPGHTRPLPGMLPAAITLLCFPALPDAPWQRIAGKFRLNTTQNSSRSTPGSDLPLITPSHVFLCLKNTSSAAMVLYSSSLRSGAFCNQQHRNLTLGSSSSSIRGPGHSTGLQNRLQNSRVGAAPAVDSVDGEPVGAQWSHEPTADHVRMG